MNDDDQVNDEGGDDGAKSIEPLGAQVLRKMHAGLRSLHAECTKMAGPLDACGAKDMITGALDTLGGHRSELMKGFGKLYKDLDPLKDEDDDPADADDQVADDAGDTDNQTGEVSDDDIDAALGALGEDGDDAGDDAGDDEAASESADEGGDDDADPELERRAKALEQRLAHKKRLLDALASRQANA